MYIYIYIYLPICVHLYTYIYTHTYMCVYVYTHTYMHAYVHIDVYMCQHTHIHITIICRLLLIYVSVCRRSLRTLQLDTMIVEGEGEKRCQASEEARGSLSSLMPTKRVQVPLRRLHRPRNHSMVTLLRPSHMPYTYSDPLDNSCQGRRVLPGCS